jgi:hypothetical protein
LDGFALSQSLKDQTIPARVLAKPAITLAPRTVLENKSEVNEILVGIGVSERQACYQSIFHFGESPVKRKAFLAFELMVF